MMFLKLCQPKALMFKRFMVAHKPKSKEAIKQPQYLVDDVYLLLQIITTKKIVTSRRATAAGTMT